MKEEMIFYENVQIQFLLQKRNDIFMKKNFDLIFYNRKNNNFDEKDLDQVFDMKIMLLMIEFRSD